MDNEEEVEKKQRISYINAAFLILAALAIDAFQALLTLAGGVGLVLNSLIAVFAGLTFWLWFRLCDVDFIKDPKRFLVIMAQNVGEFIPALNNLPLYFAGVTITIILVWLEDRIADRIPIVGKVLKLALNVTKGKLSFKSPNLASAKANTLKGNRAILERQRARRTARGLGESPRVAPTLTSSRNANLQGNQALLRRQVQRKGMDINSK